MMTVVFVGLGSNLESPVQQVSSAVGELAALKTTKLLQQSSLYRSRPVGPQDQDDFINAVVMLETEMQPLDLLDALQDLENRHGRRRLRHWGPRTLDLDILAYGDSSIASERLTIPHPEIANRTFVLKPWAEIQPDWSIPGLGRVSDVLANSSEAMPERVS